MQCDERAMQKQLGGAGGGEGIFATLQPASNTKVFESFPGMDATSVIMVDFGAGPARWALWVLGMSCMVPETYGCVVLATYLCGCIVIYLASLSDHCGQG